MLCSSMDSKNVRIEWNLLNEISETVVLCNHKLRGSIVTLGSLLIGMEESEPFGDDPFMFAVANQALRTII